MPEFLNDKNLCGKCKFKTVCRDDMNRIFFGRKRRGGSLVNVLVFFIAAVLITAQVFFFSVDSSKSVAEDTYLIQARLNLAAQVEKAKEEVRLGRITEDNNGIFAGYYEYKKLNGKLFYDLASKDIYKNMNNIVVDVYHLNYTFYNDNGSELKRKWEDQTGEKNMHKKIFPPMGANHYLIRAYTKLKSSRFLMYQVLVKKNGTSAPSTLSYEEIWY